jgi:hypothetical protein
MAGAKTVSECEFLVWDHGTIRRLAKAYPQLKFEVRDRPLRSEAQPEMKIVCASRALDRRLIGIDAKIAHAVAARS